MQTVAFLSFTKLNSSFKFVADDSQLVAQEDSRRLLHISTSRFTTGNIANLLARK